MPRKAEYTDRPLTAEEREFAAEHHGLIYRYMKNMKLDPEEWYDLLIVNYLQSVKRYFSNPQLHVYGFVPILFRRLDAARQAHFKAIKAKKRKPSGTLVSLDAEYAEIKNLYNCIGIVGGKSPESEIVAMEQMTEMLSSLSDTQRKIAELKVDGYSSKEIYSALKMKPSTYYVEVNRIKKVLAEMIG